MAEINLSMLSIVISLIALVPFILILLNVFILSPRGAKVHFDVGVKKGKKDITSKKGELLFSVGNYPKFLNYSIKVNFVAVCFDPFEIDIKPIKGYTGSVGYLLRTDLVSHFSGTLMFQGPFFLGKKAGQGLYIAYNLKKKNSKIYIVYDVAIDETNIPAILNLIPPKTFRKKVTLELRLK